MPLARRRFVAALAAGAAALALPALPRAAAAAPSALPRLAFWPGGTCGAAAAVAGSLRSVIPHPLAGKDEGVTLLAGEEPAFLLGNRHQAAELGELTQIAELGSLAQILLVPSAHPARGAHEFLRALAQRPAPRLATCAGCPVGARLAQSLGAAAAPGGEAEWRAALRGGADGLLLRPAAALALLRARGGGARALATSAPERLHTLLAVETLEENGLGHLVEADPLGVWTRGGRRAPHAVALRGQLARDWDRVMAAMRAGCVTPGPCPV